MTGEPWRECAGPAALAVPAELLAIAAATQVSAIVVDFQPNGAFSGRNPVNFGGVESQAAAADPAFAASNVWKYLEIPPAPRNTPKSSVGGLVASGGAVTGVSISLTGSISAGDDNPIDNSGSDAVATTTSSSTAAARRTRPITRSPGSPRIPPWRYTPTHRTSAALAAINSPPMETP